MRKEVDKGDDDTDGGFKTFHYRGCAATLAPQP